VAKSLGGVVLPDQLEWLDRYDWAGVAQRSERTLAGAVIITSAPLARGRPITLEARERVAWLPQATVAAIAALAAVAGASYPLVWEDESYDVVFRHDERPAFTVEPLFPHGDQYVAEIKLATI